MQKQLQAPLAGHFCLMIQVIFQFQLNSYFVHYPSNFLGIWGKTSILEFFMYLSNFFSFSCPSREGGLNVVFVTHCFFIWRQIVVAGTSKCNAAALVLISFEVITATAFWRASTIPFAGRLIAFVERRFLKKKKLRINYPCLCCANSPIWPA